MKSALIRVDGGMQIGKGHLVRCLGFVEKSSNHGIESVFVVRNYEKKVLDLVEHHGFRTHPIEKLGVLKKMPNLQQISLKTVR